MNKNWELHPRVGIGHLKLGFSRQRVDSYSSTYGSIVREIEFGEEESEEEFKEFLSEFGLEEELTDQEIANAISSAQNLQDSISDILDERRSLDYDLALEYRKDKLFAITVDKHNVELNFEGSLIFQSPAPEFLKKLQRINDGAKVHGEDILFDKIGVLLTGFFYKGDTGAWAFFREGDHRFEDRFVTVFSLDEIDQFLTDDFVEVDLLSL